MSIGSDVIIRPAQVKDSPQVVSLVTSILAKEFPADQTAYAMDDIQKLMETYAFPTSSFLVAVDDDRIVGTCGIKADGPDTAILRRLFVAQDHRGRGIGFGLLKEALAFCRSRGFREVVIRTSTRMERAIQLCKALGFEEGGCWTMGQVTLIRFHLRLT